MRAPAHILIGAGCGLVLAGPALTTHLEVAGVATVGLAMVGSLLPDLDHERAVARKVPLIGPLASTAVRFLSETLSTVRPIPNPYPETISGSHLVHRGPWHTPVIAFALYMLLRLTSAPDFVAQAVVWGFISHLIADTMTSMGIAWLWPIYDKVLNATRVEIPIALLVLALCIHSVDPGLLPVLAL